MTRTAWLATFPMVGVAVVACTLTLHAQVQQAPGQRQNVAQQQIPQQRVPAPGAGGVVQPAQPQQPAWFPLAAEHQKWVDDVLAYWEFSSVKIERYRCEFERFQYDPIFGPRGTPKTISKGLIQYAAPDKGSYQVTDVQQFVAPPAAPGEQAQFANKTETLQEHWICDGRSIFEHDYQNKQLKQYKLAAELQGQGIVDSPLPFLFGANKEKIKARYWIRNVTPQDKKDEYWLEVWPKFTQDARNYQRVQVIIAQQDYLPKAIVLFDPAFNEKTNPALTSFHFKQRETNWNILGEQLNPFHRAFHEPATPRGWQKIVENFPAPEGAGAPAGNHRAAQLPQQQR